MVIGITGGIGCGKSTVLNILKDKYNAHIIDADKTAHRLMEPYKQVYNSIRESFGDEIIGSDGFIDRKRLAQIVFSDKEKLDCLNKIVHPRVKEAVIAEIASAKEELIAVEAALFIEAGYVDICDELWYIYTDNETRIQRLIKSRGYTRKKAESIIANQLSDNEFREHCNIVIDNSGSKNDTEGQIAAVLKGVS